MNRKDEIIPRIQKAALAEFTQKGLQESSMEGIAKSAETTKRTLYKYYSSKDVVFNEIIGLLLDKFDAYSNFKYSMDKSIEAQISEIIESKIELMTNDSYIKMSKLLLIELIKSNPIDEVHYKRFYKSEKKFISWIKDAQKDGKVSVEQSPELIANQFLSIMKGQIFHPVLFGMSTVSKKDIKTCQQSVKSFFINSFCRTVKSKT